MRRWPPEPRHFQPAVFGEGVFGTPTLRRLEDRRCWAYRPDLRDRMAVRMEILKVLRLEVGAVDGDCAGVPTGLRRLAEDPGEHGCATSVRSTPRAPSARPAAVPAPLHVVHPDQNLAIVDPRRVARLRDPADAAPEVVPWSARDARSSCPMVFSQFELCRPRGEVMAEGNTRTTTTPDGSLLIWIKFFSPRKS